MLYFIVNETARTGKGTGVWRQVQKELRARKISYKAYMTERKGHATELAKKLSEEIEEEFCLIVVGGDGTLNEVINGITDFSKVRCSLIPAGSGNDFARGIGISREPIERLNQIMTYLEHGKDAYIDLGKAEWPESEKPRLFAISSGVGMDALVCKKAATSKVKVILNKLGMGKLSYLVLTVQSLFTMKKADMAVKVDDTGTLNLRKGIFGAAMNAKAEGGGVPMAPQASMQDGKLSACFVYKYTKFGALLRLPLLAVGAHEKCSGFQVFDCDTIHVKIKAPMALHTDGEYLGDVTEIRYSCLQGRLRFLL